MSNRDYGISSIKKEDGEPQKRNEEVIETLYGIHAEELSNNNEVAAATVKSGDKTIYKIAFSTEGQPYKVNSGDRLSALTFNKTQKYKLKKVSKEIYEAYIGYLKNAQDSKYAIVQRMTR